MDGKDQTSLNNHESSGGNDESSTDDEYHSDNENIKKRAREFPEIYKQYKPFARMSSQSRHTCPTWPFD